MDFYAMKRRKLQGLCKKHGIRANMKNIEMAERLTLLFNNKQEDEKYVIQVDVDQVESYRSSADEVESATTVSWICNGDSTKEVTVCKHISPELKKCATAASTDSISGDEKTAERIAYTWKMGEDSSSKDIRGESLLFSISSDGHRHSYDAADITGPGGMEVGKENTVDDTDGFGMMESVSCEKVDKGLDTGIYDSEEGNHLLSSKDTEEILKIPNIGTLASMLKREMGVDFPTDSPVTASDFETRALELEDASPILNNFGLKGLLRDDQTGLKKPGLEMSEGTSKSEYIEDVKNEGEFVENTHVVVEEPYHQEHNVMGEVLELKSTPETSNHCHIGPSLIDTNVCIPSFWDDSEVKSCTDNTCGKPETCSDGAFASVLNVFPPLGNLCGLKEFSKADSENVKEKVSTDACLEGQPAENMRVSEDLEAHTTIGNVMLIKQEADGNSLHSFGYVAPNTVSPEKVVGSPKIKMAAQFAGIEVSNLRLNEASGSKDSTSDEQSKSNNGNDVLVYGSRENNVVVDKVSTGSSEAIIGIKNVSDGIMSVEKTLQGLDDDSLLESEERHSACVKSFSDISRSWTGTYSTPSLQNVSLSCGVLEKIHLSVQEGNGSIYLKPGRVSGLKFKGLNAGIDDSRHEIKASENIASPLVNNLGMNWLFGDDEVKKLDPELSNAISISDVKNGNGGEAIRQVGAGELSGHKHQVIEEVFKVKSTQELGFHYRLCSPVTEFFSHENKVEGWKATLPLSNSFGLQGLFKHEHASGLEQSGLGISKCNPNTEYIEDVKNFESVDTSLVGEELHHEEHKMIGEFVEQKSTGSALMNANVHNPSFWDDSTEAEPCLDNACSKRQKCKGATRCV